MPTALIECPCGERILVYFTDEVYKVVKKANFSPFFNLTNEIMIEATEKDMKTKLSDAVETEAAIGKDEAKAMGVPFLDIRKDAPICPVCKGLLSAKDETCH